MSEYVPLVKRGVRHNHTIQWAAQTSPRYHMEALYTMCQHVDAMMKIIPKEDIDDLQSQLEIHQEMAQVQLAAPIVEYDQTPREHIVIFDVSMSMPLSMFLLRPHITCKEVQTCMMAYETLLEQLNHRGYAKIQIPFHQVMVQLVSDFPDIGFGLYVPGTTTLRYYRLYFLDMMDAHRLSRE